MNLRISSRSSLTQVNVLPTATLLVLPDVQRPQPGAAGRGMTNARGAGVERRRAHPPKPGNRDNGSEGPLTARPAPLQLPLSLYS